MEFRPIPSLDYKYEINEDGTIFRNVKNGKESKIKLDMHHSKAGYYTTFVHIGGRNLDAYTKRVMIHRAVAECWLGECPDGYEVDHIDRNPHNNHFSKLRYVTKSEQMKNRDHSRISQKGAQNLAEARNKRKIPICITKDNEKTNFSSISECARYIAEQTGEHVERIRYYLRKRQPNVFGYAISG